MYQRWGRTTGNTVTPPATQTTTTSRGSGSTY